jgi:hypothetical protein
LLDAGQDDGSAEGVQAAMQFGGAGEHGRGRRRRDFARNEIDEEGAGKGGEDDFHGRLLVAWWLDGVRKYTRKQRRLQWMKSCATSGGPSTRTARS